MWALALGAVGLVVVVYELWTKKNVDATLPGPSQLAGSPLRTMPYKPPVPAIGAAAMAKCGLLPTDLADADKWSAVFLGSSLNLPNRLNLMRSVIPGAQWPEPARRTWCALVNEGLV